MQNFDWCLSGGLVLGGGLFGFLLSGNAKTLGTGLLYGGALLALSILSLKIWRKGKSSLPFILGQAGNVICSIIPYELLGSF